VRSLRQAAREPFTLFLDESVRDDVLVVGGVIVSQQGLALVRERWRALKLRFGLEVSDELKHNIPSQRETREVLERNGWPQRLRVPAMLRVIADLPVYVVVAVRFDEPRDDDNHQPLDYYLDAMIWCALRLGNHAQRGEIAYEGPHQVVVDHPSPPADVSDRPMSQRLRRIYENSPGTAAFAHYSERWENSKMTLRGQPVPSLSSLGLAPDLYASCSQCSEALQIADVVTGAARDCAHSVAMEHRAGRRMVGSYQLDNWQIIHLRLRRGPNGAISRFGVGVFPNERPEEQEVSRVLGSPPGSWAAAA